MMKVENVIDVKLKNTKNIIDSIRFTDGLTRKDIMQQLDISFATVSNICNELKGKELIIESRMDNLSVGRSPVSISFNYNRYFILCMDLHLENRITIGLANLRSEMVYSKTFHLDHSKNLHEYAFRCHQLFNEHILSAGYDLKKIISIGIAVPAIFDKLTQNTVGSQIDFFEDQPVKKVFQEQFGMPVYVENDSNLCVISVQSKNAEKSDNLVYVFLEEGLGIGVISHGTLLTGSNGFAPEICHIPIGRETMKCKLCGQSRCVQSDLSIPGFLAKYRGDENYNSESMDREWKEFVLSVSQSFPEALKVVEENGSIMGKMVSILFNLFDPQIIYIGGMITPIFDKLYPYIYDEVVKRSVTKTDRKISILPDSNSNSILTGCAEDVFEKRIVMI